MFITYEPSKETLWNSPEMVEYVGATVSLIPSVYATESLIYVGAHNVNGEWKQWLCRASDLNGLEHCDIFNKQRDYPDINFDDFYCSDDNPSVDDFYLDLYMYCGDPRILVTLTYSFENREWYALYRQSETWDSEFDEGITLSVEDTNKLVNIAAMDRLTQYVTSLSNYATSRSNT